MSSSKKNPLFGAFKSSDPSPNEKTVEEKKLTEVVKPAESEKKPPEAVKPAESDKKLPEAVKPTESEKKSPEAVKPTESEKKSPEAAKPAESAKKPPEAVKPTENEKKPPEAVKPAENEKKPPEAVKPAETEKASAGEEIPADFHLDIVSASDLGKVIHFPLDMIDDFEDHPYPVTDDKDMDELVDSIKKFGVLEPITIIPNAKRAGRMEMVAGRCVPA